MEDELILKLMGTTIKVKIKHNNSKEILADIKEMLLDYNSRFSANHDTSQLMKINKNSGIREVKVDKDVFELVNIGKKYSISSNRALNIAIGKIVKLWKIGFYDARKPNAAEIKNALKLTNPEDIILNENNCSVYLSKKNMEIDLGSLAKGYFADNIKDYLLSKGVKTGIIDLGGNVLTLGDSYLNSHGFWLVGIQNPKKRRGEVLGLIPIKNKSVVTSGIYERTFEKNGKAYHHIFDSKTGYPVFNSIASITIISDRSLDCEIWTTILFSYSIEKSLFIINSIKNLECVIIGKDNEVYLSNGVKNIFIKL